MNKTTTIGTAQVDRFEYGKIDMNNNDTVKFYLLLRTLAV